MTMKALISVFLYLITTFSYGLQPENGTWWDPNASGSGYNIETQDNVLALTMYSYESSGLPTFYTSAGKMNSDRSYSGVLNKYVNGQCVNCNYRSPSSTTAGTVSINFTHGTRGTISFNGGAPVNIQRFAFGVDTSTSAFLYGDWAITEGTQYTGGLFSGTRMIFNAPYTSTSNVTYAVGNISGTSNLVIGGKDNTTYSNAFIITQDYSSTQYKSYIVYSSGVNSIEGTSYIYAKTSSPTGTGTNFVGFRARSYSAVNNFNAPGLSVYKPEENYNNQLLENELLKIIQLKDIFPE